MGAYKLNIGDATHYLKWNGVKLMVKGLVGDITLESDGFIRTDGKDNYADLTAGFFLGYDGGAYKLNIGNNVKYLKWTGSALQVKGLVSLDSLSAINANLGNITAGNIQGTRFQVGAGTDQDIYFEDSGIRLYDASGTGLVFAKTGLESAFILLNASAVAFGALSAPRIEFYDDDKTIINCVSKAFYFYNTGTIRLPALTSAPTAHQGDLSCNASASDWFSGYITDWEHFQTTEGW